MTAQINFSESFGRQSSFFKDSWIGRIVRRELIRDLLKNDRQEASEMLSDQR